MTAISPNIRGVDRYLLKNFERNNERTKTSVERLTTGKRINRPKDDPSGFIAAEGLRKELVDLKAKLKGVTGERAESQIKQAGLGEIQNVLTDLRGRLVSLADGAITADERAALAAEIDDAAEAVDRIAKLTGNAAPFDLDLKAAPLSASPNAAAAVDDTARGVTSERVALAAHERNHLDTFEQIYKDQIVITTEALSQIEDTDFVAETANLAQSQVLSQGSIAALAYSGRQHAAQLTQLLDAIV